MVIAHVSGGKKSIKQQAVLPVHQVSSPLHLHTPIMSKKYSRRLVDVFGSDFDTDEEVGTEHSLELTESTIIIRNRDLSWHPFWLKRIMSLSVSSADEYEDEGETSMRNPMIDVEAEVTDEYDIEDEEISDIDENMDFFEGNTEVARDEGYISEF